MIGFIPPFRFESWCFPASCGWIEAIFVYAFAERSLLLTFTIPLSRFNTEMYALFFEQARTYTHTHTWKLLEDISDILFKCNAPNYRCSCLANAHNTLQNLHTLATADKRTYTHTQKYHRKQLSLERRGIISHHRSIPGSEVFTFALRSKSCFQFISIQVSVSSMFSRRGRSILPRTDGPYKPLYHKDAWRYCRRPS